MRILTWNLFHGRSLPGAGRSLEAEFTAALSSWPWDVALLQEVPPWWPSRLARSLGAEQRAALTSRNAGLALRRALAVRWPDLAKSNGGGCNAILARQPVVAHRVVRMRTWPERRVAQFVRLRSGIGVVNFHGSARVALAEDELQRLWALSEVWAGDAPLVLGGDLNLRSPRAPAGTLHLAQRDVDHLFVRGLARTDEARRLQRGVTLMDGRTVELSDHVPLLACALRREGQG